MTTPGHPRPGTTTACAGGGDVLAAGEITFTRTPDGRAPPRPGLLANLPHSWNRDSAAH
ncbi:hypothetical protein [Streptomyces sp. NPDC002328]|uniref:hypothetical protein n=1 Tax=Streptomyces sp. NPDC002328 TaxID=3364642 RepID=UPI0036BCF362